MRKRFKRISAFGLLAVGWVLLGAQSCNSSTTAEQDQVDSQLGIYNKNQPIHTYQYSAERAELQQILDQRVRGQLNTWSVWSAYNGQPIGMCASKGFPLPYSTELTNPWQATAGGPTAGSGNVAVGQMDPQGTYPSQNTLATFVMCIAQDGSIHPEYHEELVSAYTHPVVIKDGKLTDAGQPTAESALAVKP